MKTKYIPALVMLTAGLIDCLYTMFSGLGLLDFTKRLLIVLIVFYIIGVVIKIIIDMNFKNMDDTDKNTEPEETTVDEQPDNVENINTDEETEASDN